MKMKAVLFISGLLAAVYISGLALGTSYEPGEKKIGSSGNQQANLQTADRLDNFHVENLKGDRLGRVQEVLIDVARGRIGYVVVGTDVPVETAEQYVIPWNALQPSAKAEILVLQSDRTDLQEIPRQDLLRALQGEEGLKIHRYYGVAPYWEQGSQRAEPHKEPDMR